MTDKQVLLFENGSIWQWPTTENKNQPNTKTQIENEAKRANWFTIAGDKFHEIGFDSPPDEVRKKCSQIIDLNGKLVLPGLHDSHIHIYHIGETAEYLDLTECSSIEDLKERVRKHAIAFPNSNWIVGVGWEQDKLSSEAQYPTRYDLDDVVKERPVLLWRACWHVAVVNTKALEIAGLDIHKIDWDIPGGVVDVNALDKSLTGILRESATLLVHRCVGETSDDIRLKYLQYGLQECLEFGLTAVHTNDHNSWELYHQLQLEGKLPIRVYLTPDHDEIGKGKIPPAGTKIGLLSCDRVKIFADGSLGAETAALRRPYRGTENKGVLVHTDEEMLNLVSKAEASGYRLEIHAIGDRAAAQVFNAFKLAKIKPERRPILTHCQVLGEDLIREMSDLGVIGNIQPSFVVTDTPWAKKRLEESTLPFSYCWKRMMESGIICAGGSDAPIETANPFQGIYDAIFRCSPGQDEDSGLNPVERLTFSQILKMYTENGAYTANDENQLGDIRPNFKADFAILNEDVASDPSKLLNINLVQSVWVDGIKRFDEIDKSMPNSKIQFNASGLAGKNGKFKICRCCRV